jgi:HEAT repeat protein
MGLFNLSSTPPDVAKLREAGDVKGLIRALRFKKDAAVRSAAAEALGAKFDFKSAGRMASFGLRFLGLQNVAPAERRKTVADSFSAYTENDPSRVLAALAAALGDEDAAVRGGAAKALGRMWCTPGTLRAFTGNEIRFLQPADFAQIERSVVASRSGPAVLRSLIARLQDGDGSVRAAAVEALAETRESTAISALAQVAANDPDPEICAAAKRAVEALEAIAARESSRQ